MIRVAVELWPFGGEEGKKTLKEVFIHNLGNSDDLHRGNYGVRTSRIGAIQAWVPNYPRLSYSVLELVYRALAGLRESKNGRF